MLLRSLVFLLGYRCGEAFAICGVDGVGLPWPWYQGGGGESGGRRYGWASRSSLGATQSPCEACELLLVAFPTCHQAVGFLTL